MTSVYKQLRMQDPAAAELYRYLTNEEQVSPESFDQGSASLDLSTPSEPIFFWKGQGDGQTSVPEVFRRSLEHLSVKVFEDPYLTELEDKLGFIPPWIFTDLDETTTKDKEVFNKLEKIVTDVSDSVRSEKFSSHEIYVKDMMSRLVAAVFEEWPSIYNAETATADNAVDMLEKPVKNCLEVTILFYTIFSLAGLKPQIIKLRRIENGSILKHVVLGVPIGAVNNHELLYFDFGNNNYIGPAYSDVMSHPYGLNDLLAEFFINRYYATDSFASSEEKEQLLLKAYRFAPDRFRTSYHLADFYKERGDLNAALKYYQISWDISQHPGVEKKLTKLRKTVSEEN